MGTLFKTVTLLNVAKNYWKGREDVLFYHVSTDEVYGSLTEQEAPFTEGSNYRPNSPYSAGWLRSHF